MAAEEPEKRHTTSSNGGDEPWGTLEELLLACAVNRHGPDSWDSIAMELRKRTSSRNRNNHTNTNDGNSFSNAFTPLSCEHKYRDLKRRFSVDNSAPVSVDGKGLAAGKMDGNGARTAGGVVVPDSRRDELPCIIDELRKLRVEELRREVQRHDSSIVSLQLKVKRLEEEKEKEKEKERREKSSKSDEAVRSADLIVQTHGNGTGTRGEHKEQEETSRPAAQAAGFIVAVTGGGTDESEDRSFNESNSTSHKDENRRATAEAERISGRGPQGDLSKKPDRVQMESDVGMDTGCSVSGGSGRLGNNWRVKAETDGSSRPGESNELKDSVSESKRDVNGVAKQSSDVLSSASLSRRRRSGWRGGGGGCAGSSSGDEVDVEEASPANGRVSVKSQPLIRLMENLCSHKHGLVFERRLPSQETGKYRSMIRQHMDLDTVQSKLDKGLYWDSHLSFYRDLLLLFTNAIQFYPVSSAEHIAACELRKLVNQEISQVTWKPKPEPDFQLLDPVVKKPRSATTMIICRSRVPTPPKPSSGEEADGEKIAEGNGIKAKIHANTIAGNVSVNGGDHVDSGSNKSNEKKGNLSRAKKFTKPKPAASGNNINEGSHTNNNKKKTGNNIDSKKGNKQEKAAGSAATKRLGVANFLRRMKQNSPAREATVAEDVEIGSEGSGGGVGESKKERDDKKRTGKKKKKEAAGIRGNAKGGAKEEEEEEELVVVRRTSGRKQGKKDQEKDAVGRPRSGAGRQRKRKAAGDVAEPPAGKRKRGGGGEKEVGDGGGSTGRPKKRTRR